MRHLLKMLIISIMLVFCCDSLMESENYACAKSSREAIAQETLHTEKCIKNTLPSLQVYFSIKRYCKDYDVPEKYAFKVANIESGWKQPIQVNYNPYNKISSTNALGAMQVLPSTARSVWQDKSITEEKLLNDVDFNVHTSIKYMQQLYDEHHDWAKVFAVYNTGYTHLNDYALVVVNYTNTN